MTGRFKISIAFLKMWLIFGLSILCSGYPLLSQLPDTNKLPIESISAEISSKTNPRDTIGLLILAKKYEDQAGNYITDTPVLADLRYFSGVCYLLGHNYNQALINLEIASGIKKRLGITDKRSLNSIYNIGVAYNLLGNYIKSLSVMTEYLDEGKKFYGEKSTELASAYAAILGGLMEIKDYDRLKSFVFEVFDMLSVNDINISTSDFANLYINLGTAYVQLSDFAKGKVYLELAMDFYTRYDPPVDETYICLINNLALTYGTLGIPDKEKEYFDMGIPLAVSNNSYLAFNLINSYAIKLGNSGNPEKGGTLLSNVVRKAGSAYGTDSRYYTTVLMNYAEYIRIYEDDYINSIRLFLECLNYLNDHKEEILLRDQVLLKYSMALSGNSEHLKALETIQDLLYKVTDSGKIHNLYENPELSLLKPDTRMLRILRSKHEILQNLYSASPSIEVLEAAANTSESIISLIDRIRISISEEDSRIVLGDRYRDLYLKAIYDFEQCFKATGEKRFLEKTFEYTERCKAAGLLAATRELNAIQFHIPPDIAELEKSLQREIGYLNSMISEENKNASYDADLYADLKSKLLIRIRTRDSLIMTFEKDFPGYYTIKYDRTAPEMKDIPSIAGRNNNYLNYVLSDSVLNIFLVNRKNQIFLSQPIDSSFFRKVKEFRLLLSNPSKNDNARKDFNKYQEIGFELYKYLIDPVSKYFISDDLLISPDNLLLYIPFEVLITSKYNGTDILYRELNYLMNEYNISYAYSATFENELINRKPGRNKDLVAFAPVYGTDLNVDSILLNRQVQNWYLSNLTYSREEAEYVSSIRKGRLFLDSDARESEYKKIAGSFGIIHLAMHTVLNDQNPMNSAMVFTMGNDSIEDGLLYTYEVYGIPLRALMVVLSSCNTGSGMLSTGEGILSLARGFLYSGSQSVVMAMWEIDDKSGTDVVKMFYDNLRRGKPKSISLKSARIKYLKSASQLRSHPYFWSSLVIYGDDVPVFFRWKSILVITGSILLLAALAIFYFRYRKYS